VSTVPPPVGPSRQCPIDQRPTGPAVPFLVQHLFELLLRGIEGLGAARSHDMRVRHFSREQVKETHVPMTMSDDGCLVRRRTFSGPSKRHTLNPRPGREKA